MSNGKLRPGQLYDRSLDVAIPFTERMLDDKTAGPLVGTNRIDLTPHDQDSILERVYDATALGTALDAYSKGRAGFVDMSSILPPVLTEVVISYNKSGNNGDHQVIASGAATGTSAALSLSVDSASQGGAGVIPDLTFKIKYYDWAKRVPCTEWYFYVAGNFSIANLLTRLTTLAGASVLQFPALKAETVSLTLFGQSVSLSARAEAQQSEAFSPSTTSFTRSIGFGTSKDQSLTTKNVTIPPTLHGNLTIADPTSSKSALAAAVCGIASGAGWPALSSAASTGLVDATASVTPTSITATSPTTIPTAGLYLVDINHRPFELLDYTIIQATVVDMSYFA